MNETFNERYSCPGNQTTQYNATRSPNDCGKFSRRIKMFLLEFQTFTTAADPRWLGMRSPSQSNFFSFHAFPAKLLPNNGLKHPLPRLATSMFSSIDPSLMFNIKFLGCDVGQFLGDNGFCYICPANSFNDVFNGTCQPCGQNMVLNRHSVCGKKLNHVLLCSFFLSALNHLKFSSDYYRMKLCDLWW